MTRDGVAQTTAARVADTWLRAGTALGCALRPRDITALWPTYGEGHAPRPLSRHIQNLMRTGVLIRVEARRGSSRYAHVDAPVCTHERTASTDLAPVALAAVTHATQQYGRFVSTREVTEALQPVGFEGCVDKALKTRLWQTLLALASSKVPLTPEAPDAPAKLQSVITQRPSGAKAERARVFWWAPLGAPYAPPTLQASASPREAAMRLVAGACTALGRPVTSAELKAYARGLNRGAEDPSASTPMTKRQIVSALKAARLDNGGAARAHRQFGVVTHQTVYTAGRLVPPRFSVTTASDVETRLMHASDLLTVLNPAQECALMDAVLANASIGTQLAADLVSLRRAVLYEQLTSVVPAAAWSAVLIPLRASVEQLYVWHDGDPLQGPGSAATRRELKALDHRVRDLNAVEEILRGGPVAMPARFADIASPRVLGTGPTLSFDDLAPIHASLAALQRGRDGVHPVFRRARRIAGVRPPGWRAGEGQAPTWERLDRVDAYALAVEYVGAPQTLVLVADAVLLLGGVLRDERVLFAALESAGPGDEWIVRGLHVALGLLGHLVPTALWLSNERLVHGGVLSTVLADPDGGVAALRGLLRVGDSGARQVISDALVQVESGEWLALLG